MTELPGFDLQWENLIPKCVSFLFSTSQSSKALGKTLANWN